MTDNSSDTIEVEGTVKTLHPNTFFQVVLDDGGEILTHLSGKMRKRYIRLTVGDRVRIEISKYDLSKGRIVYRLSEKTVFASGANKSRTHQKRYKR